MRPSHLLGVDRLRLFSLRGDDLRQSTPFRLLRHVVRQFSRRRRLLAHRIREHEGVFVPHLAHQRHRVRVFLFRLAAKSGDEIARQRHARNLLSRAPRQRNVRLPRVPPSHALQHGRRTALRRHVQLLRDVGSIGDDAEHLVWKIFWVRRRESNAHLRVHVRRGVEELRESNRAVASGFIHAAKTIGVVSVEGVVARADGQRWTRAVGVRVDVLSQQRHLAVALVGESSHLLKDGSDRSRPLAPARERHDAEGAHVIAPAHDGDECGRSGIRAAHGRDVGVRLLERELDVDGGADVDVTAVGGNGGVAARGVDEPREVAVRVRARDEVR